MTKPIYEELEFSVRTAGCLKNQGIDTLQQFLAIEKEDLIQWRNAGVRVWEEIQAIQKHLATDPIEVSISNAASILNQFLVNVPSTFKAEINEDGLVSVYRKLL
jgi:hypothetical protein